MKPGRNDPCICGSGKKYKKCCQEKLESHSPAQSLEQKTAADVHFNLGRTLQELGSLDEAVASYRRALQINPDFADAHFNLGCTLNGLGRLDEAEASYRWALQIKPDDAEACNNLGNTLNNLGRLDEAKASYRRALQIKPDYAEAHNNLGNSLKDFGRLVEAEASYHRALQIKPDYADAYSNLLFTHNYTASHTPSYCLEEAKRYGQMVDKKVTARLQKWSCVMQPQRLRVGLVSGDLRNHPVGYFLESILSQIDSSRVELIAYSTEYKADALTTRIKPYFTEWKLLAGQNDAAAARLINNDGIHVLLDLSGHTRHNRLPMFAWKPAPVQASWLGYFATTGVMEMDYLLGDPWVLPEAEEEYFTEKIWRLPETRLCFTVPDVDVNVNPLPALVDRHITFGCFNDLTKMNDDVVVLWARVLRAVPGSRLFLKAKQLKEKLVRHSVAERFSAHGISVDRLILEGPVSRPEYLAAYQRVDIALDPFPFTGGTTSAEALWMGVPVLTLAGDRFLSRQGVGIMMNAGLNEWVATDPDDYVARAIAHTSDLNQLANLRAGLRAQVLKSPIFDAARFARNFESALWGMWQTWVGQQGKK